MKVVGGRLHIQIDKQQQRLNFVSEYNCIIEMEQLIGRLLIEW